MLDLLCFFRLFSFSASVVSYAIIITDSVSRYGSSLNSLGEETVENRRFVDRCYAIMIRMFSFSRLYLCVVLNCLETVWTFSPESIKESNRPGSIFFKVALIKQANMD